MTIWSDHDRIERIKRIVKDIRHDLALIDANLRHMGTKPLDVTRSRPLNAVGTPVDLNPGVSGEGDE